MSHHVSSAHTQQVFIHINSPELAPPTEEPGFSCHLLWLSQNPLILLPIRDGERLDLQTTYSQCPCLHARPELLL